LLWAEKKRVEGEGTSPSRVSSLGMRESTEGEKPMYPLVIRIKRRKRSRKKDA